MCHNELKLGVPTAHAPRVVPAQCKWGKHTCSSEDPAQPKIITFLKGSFQISYLSISLKKIAGKLKKKKKKRLTNIQKAKGNK